MSLVQLKKRFATLPVAAFLSLVFVAGAVFPVPATAAEPSAAAKTAHKVHVVTMSHTFSYEPQTLEVNVGDTIVWKDTDLYQHTVTSVDRKSFNSGPINPGGSWRYKAVKEGTYAYFCVPHPNMRGTLIVHARQ